MTEEESGFKDKGYAWVVVFCGFSLNTLQASFFSVYGVIYLELVEYFETSKSVVSWIGAVQQLLFGISGLLAGPLVRMYGVRKAGIITPMFVVIGYFATAFCSQIWTVVLTYAVLTGIGHGCYGLCAISAVYPWFSDKTSLAISIAMLGISVGSFIWPPLVTWLVHVYSWKGALIMCGGIHLQAFVLFALLKPPDMKRKGKNSRTVQPKDIGDTGTLPDTLSKDQSRINGNSKKHFLSWLVLFKEISFPLTYVGVFLTYMGYITTYAYTTTRGILLGYSATEAALLSAIVGAGGVVGRILAGLLGNTIGCNKRLYASAIMTSTAGITSIVSMLSAQYWYLAGYCAIWGAACGFHVVLMLSGMVDIYGNEYSAEMVGFNLTCGGISFLLTNIFTGMILDWSPNPSLPFVVFGSAHSLAGVLVFISTYIKRNCVNRNSKSLSQISPKD